MREDGVRNCVCGLGRAHHLVTTCRFLVSSVLILQSALQSAGVSLRGEGDPDVNR